MKLQKAKTTWFPVPKSFTVKGKAQDGSDVETIYVLDPEEKSRICIKELSPGESADVSTKNLKLQQEYSSAGQDKTILKASPDYWGYRSGRVVKSFDGWEGFFGFDGTELKCTPDNVLQFISMVPGFLEFCEDCIEKNNELIAERRSAEMGNS